MFFNSGAKGAGTAIEKIAEKVEKVKALAKMVPAMAVFAGAFGAIESLTKPTMKDLIDNVNKGFKDFANQVNTRLAQTKDYVDASIVRAIKDIVKSQLIVMEQKWTFCMNIRVDRLVRECQRDAVR